MPSLKFAVIHFIFLVFLSMSAYGNINCVTRKSDVSSACNDCKARIGCNNGETLVSCGLAAYLSNEMYVDGSYIDGNECVAQNGHHGQGVYAYARCCSFEHDFMCNPQNGDWVSYDGSKSVSICPSLFPYLMGCSAWSGYHAIDG